MERKYSKPLDTIENQYLSFFKLKSEQNGKLWIYLEEKIETNTNHCWLWFGWSQRIREAHISTDNHTTPLATFSKMFSVSVGTSPGETITFYREVVCLSPPADNQNLS